MKRERISVDQHVYEYITNRAIPYEDKEPNDTLRRLFGLNELPDRPESEKIKKLRAPLRYVLEVWDLMQEGHERIGATHAIARKYSVARPTIHDAYTRRLGLNTREFDDLSSDGLRVKLVEEFPNYENDINLFMDKKE